MKKIIAVSMVKNEQDIIESFVRHTLSFADGLLICDHMSVDKTSEILQKLAAEGLPITTYSETNPAYEQAEVMTRLIHEAKASGADLILPLDADEFVLPKRPGDNVRKILDGLECDRVHRLFWRQFTPVDECTGVFVLYRKVVGEKDYNTTRKVIIGASAVKPGMIIELGNHGVHIPDSSALRGYVPVPPQDIPTLFLAHFWARNEVQYAAKSITMWLNTVARSSKFACYCLDARRNYEMLLHQGTTAYAEEIAKMIPFDLRSYAAKQKLRYPPVSENELLLRVLDVSLKLAQNCAELDVLTKRIPVTTVVVFDAEDEQFRISIESVIEQEYPWQDVFIWPTVDKLPPSDMMDGLSRRGMEFTILSVDEAEAARNLTLKAKGKYVQFLLPGEKVGVRKLQTMISFWEEFPFDTELVIGQEGDHHEKRFAAGFSNLELWRYLLFLGHFKGNTLAAALVRREFAERTRWLQGCFWQKIPLQLLIWQRWFNPQDEHQLPVALLYGTYALPAKPDPAVAFAGLLTWGTLLANDVWLSSDKKIMAWENLRRAAEDILSRPHNLDPMFIDVYAELVKDMP